MRRTRVASVAFAAVTVCSVIETARGEIVHFTNPAPGEKGHYNWRYEPVEGWFSWLDITVAADQQTNLPNGNSISQSYENTFFETNYWSGGLGTAQVFVDDPGAGGWFTYVYARAFGEQFVPIIGESGWGYAGIFANAKGGNIFSHFNEEYRYIGVRTQSGNRGWVEVARNGMNLTAVAWAYETEAGVPILAGQIPAPGPLALLAIGLVFPRRRRA